MSHKVTNNFGEFEKKVQELKSRTSDPELIKKLETLYRVAKANQGIVEMGLYELQLERIASEFLSLT